MSKLTASKILEMVKKAEPIYNESMGYYFYHNQNILPN